MERKRKKWKNHVGTYDIAELLERSIFGEDWKPVDEVEVESILQ